MMHLIQGFFFAESPQIGIGYDETGARAILHEVIERSMFCGIIGPERDDSDILIGSMTDHYGDSTLRGILIGADTFNFVKLYNHRTDHIDYEFKKNTDSTWVGTFNGKATGSGQARCILTSVPKSFLIPIQTRPIRKGGPRGDPLERYRK